MAGMRALGIRQLAVSIPHKQAVMEHLDEIDATARRIGAVNTVTLREGRLCGSNTDWLGAVRALETERSLDGTSAVVLGAGGAARAVTFGLLEKGASVCVLNRTPEKATELARDLGASDAGPLSTLGKRDFDVLVNTTSVGLGSDESAVPADAHREGTLVMDIVYEPERTRLLRDAEAAGALTIGGKWMLIHQAAEQIREWTQQNAPLEPMATAFDGAGRG
jgi:shikimate dehydrogenase